MSKEGLIPNFTVIQVRVGQWLMAMMVGHMPDLSAEAEKGGHWRRLLPLSGIDGTLTG